MATGKKPEKRIKRFVMLGSPNQGAELAEKLGDNPAFIAVFGSAGQQLGKRWAELKPTLATPACEFGIIAGGTQFDKGFNPLLKEDNDGLLTVESTKLAGAADFLVLPVIHACLVNDPNAMQCTLRFLEHGYFLSPADRHPLN